MADSGQDFEALWSQLQRDVGGGDTIRNWTRDKGYIGDGFVIHTVKAGLIEVDPPGAENLQRIPREDFTKVYRHWEDYNAGHTLRSQIRDITRFSKYIISIFHHIESVRQ